jgi:hypothetical protein
MKTLKEIRQELETPARLASILENMTSKEDTQYQQLSPSELDDAIWSNGTLGLTRYDLATLIGLAKDEGSDLCYRLAKLLVAQNQP